MADSIKGDLRYELHAILAADVVGYTALLGKNQALTLRILSGHREIFAKLIEDHNGSIIFTAGDSIVAVFKSAFDAVECATVVQPALADRNANEASMWPMQFRMGVNVGELVIINNKPEGTGIAIAARIESIAEPGNVWISDNVFGFLRNVADFKFEDKGAHQVKNIEDPVQAYSVRQAGGTQPETETIVAEQRHGDAVLETADGPYFVRFAPSIEIGRSRVPRGANMVIGYRKASRLGKQCTITIRDREFVVTDHGSTNGTFLDDSFIGESDAPVLDLNLGGTELAIGGAREPPAKGPCRFTLRAVYGPEAALTARLVPQTLDLVDRNDLDDHWPNAERDFRTTWVFSSHSVLIGGSEDCAVRLPALAGRKSRARLELVPDGFALTPEAGAALSLGGVAATGRTTLTDGARIELDGQQLDLKYLAD